MGTGSGGGLTYRAAGVDLEAASRAVELIRGLARSTHRPGVLGEVGGFGGFFALDTARYRRPVLVAATDGVGTKLRIAQALDRHDTVGIDLVAMCANDVLVHGAEPLFFLDYLAVGRLAPERVASIVAGIAAGCREAGCVLIGGETAEMPGFYGPEEYDLAGFVVGVVEREALVDGGRVRPGDAVVGLASAGLHSNGYSLARKALLEAGGYRLEDPVPALGCTLGEELLRPTRIYVRTVLPLLDRYDVRGMAHITGGGLPENIVRVLPPGTRALLRSGSWDEPPVFGLIREAGRVAEEEMRRVFNLGVGFVLVVPAAQAWDLVTELRGRGEKAWVIGEVVAGEPAVEFA
ncbi:MAG: phosphoribosylformylglycinamidine cyclo-ligase [Desulfotomaculales bacterium]